MDSRSAECPVCGGSGVRIVFVPASLPIGRISQARLCFFCNGNGWVSTPQRPESDDEAEEE